MTSHQAFDIQSAYETLFFKHVDSILRQRLDVQIRSSASEPQWATATVTASGERATTSIELRQGTHEYTVYAPTLWPERQPDPRALLRVATSRGFAEHQVSVGLHRPWTIYLLSDVCTDYTWAYSDEDTMVDDDARLLLTEMDLADATADRPQAERNRYNLVHAREVAYFLDRYPDQAERLWQHIRKGTVTLNPFFNMAMTSAMSLEELVRQFYPACAWASEHSLDMSYANHQETPSITWGMATVLAECGIGHLVKSILPYECPWASRLQEPPVYAWEGPDGSRILVRMRKTDYAEGRFVTRGLDETNRRLHHEILPRYERMGSAYPFGGIALIGSYSDLAAKSPDMARSKAETVVAYAKQGWDYPRLVNASHKQYWDHLEHEMASRNIRLPVLRGDYGTSWEAWPACMAVNLAGWRRAQERALAADGLMAMTDALGLVPSPETSARLSEGWLNLLSLSDHAWNGRNAENLALNADLRTRWQNEANAALDDVVTERLAALARAVPNNGRRAVIANPRGWKQNGVIVLDGIDGRTTAHDAVTGNPLATQWDSAHNHLYVLAEKVPALGYKSVLLAPDADPMDASRPQVRPIENGLDSPYYRLRIDPATGTVVSLYDKLRGHEMVDETSAYGLNEALYWSDGVEHRSKGAQIEAHDCGPVLGQLTVRARVADIDIETTYTLYVALDRVDIENRVSKPVSEEKQQLDFAYPLNVPERRVQIGTPGAVIDATSEYRPGAGLAYTVAREFVDMANDEYGVLFTQRDSLLVEFGHRTTLEDPTSIGHENGTLCAVALENIIDWNESAHDQLGETEFRFRYSLQGHDGAWDASRATCAAWETHESLLVSTAAGNNTQGLSATWETVTVEPANVVLAYAKHAEKGGLLLRLWECGGQDTMARVNVTNLGDVEIIETDPLERERRPLACEDGIVSLAIKGRGFATLWVK